MLHQKPESAKNYSEAIANNGNNQLKAQWCCLVDKTLQANNDTKVQTWDGFFEQNEIIEASEDISFNVYISGYKQSKGPIYFFVHGAGLSGLSFGKTSKILMDKFMNNSESNTGTIVSFDCRGHGNTQSKNRSELSLERLAEDATLLYNKLFETVGKGRQVLLVGHSMGGAVVVELASRKMIPNILGVVVIDVVEGTAVKSFRHIESMLILRPQSFPNYAGAINYYIYSGLINNLDSACLSVPSLVRLNEETSKYEWVTDLLSSRAYWESWYKDMSKKFISLSVPRLLVLAETNRIDRDLMIGQMQGKFQLSIFKGCGHILHEDSPLEFADVLYTFANRNKALDPEFILALKAKYTKQ